MKVLLCLALSLLHLAPCVATDEKLCHEYTMQHANETWRQPSGALEFPYLVPAGPYEQEWDWDSVFLGTATLSWGSRPYLEGSMQNFLAATNVSDGSVPGCLTPEPSGCSSDPTLSDVLVHAKPVIIQGAWIASSAEGGDPARFEKYQPQMEALLAFWDRAPRKDPVTGLRVWHDQLESGADNCVLSQCPNHRSPCWTESQAFTLASPDLMVFLQREHVAYALFLDAWAVGQTDTAAKHRLASTKHREVAEDLKQILNERLWRKDLGYHASWNVSDESFIEARTYVIALPLFAGLVSSSQAAAITATIQADDMLSAVGMRSTSSDDPRYSNADMIVPYSNWRGPMWVNVNAMACYGLAEYGEQELAIDLANRVLTALATDLRVDSQWHEGYSTDDGSGLAAPGFLSWNTLSAELLSNLKAGINPLKLE